MLKAQGLRLNSKIGATLLVTQDGIARSGSSGKGGDQHDLNGREWQQRIGSLFAQPVMARLDSNGFHTATVFG